MFYLSLKDFLPNVLAGEYMKNNGLIVEGEKVKSDIFEGKIENIGATHTTLTNKKDKMNVPNSLILNNVLKKS
jgi:hypothetical protein